MNKAGGGTGGEAACAPPPNELSLAYVEGYFGRDRAHALLAGALLMQPGGAAPARVETVDFWRICVDNIVATGDEAHGITRRPVPKATFSTIYAAVNQMDTVGDGFRKLVELMPLSPAEIDVRFSQGRARARLHFTYRADVQVTPQLERYLESCVLVFHCALLWMTGRPVMPTNVRLPGMLKDADGSLLAGISAHRTRCNSGVTLSFDPADLCVPLGARKYQAWAAHETTMFLQSLRQVDQIGSPPRSTIVAAVLTMLAKEPLDQADAAKALGLSSSTLRRRLADDGTSYRQLSKEVRRERLIALLATDEELDDVAISLGFSDRRSLWRTCQDWLGVSPSVWRSQRANADRLNVGETVTC